MVEGNGDEIQHISFIDNFPTIRFAPGYGLNEVSPVAGLKLYVDINVGLLANLIRRDDGGDNARRHKLADDLVAGYWNPGDTAPQTRAFLDSFCSHVTRSFRFMGLHGFDRGRSEEWIKGIKAPMTVYVASEGMIAHMDDVNVRREWYGFGVHRCYPDAAVVCVKAGHFTILGHELVAAGLQTGQAVQAHL